MTVVDLLPQDAIPPIYEPTYQPVDGYDGAADDDIVVVESGESVRGYPVRYLTSHEVVDDELAGVPIAVRWCPLCGSVAVFDRRVNGTQLTFSVSGKLADDTLVMYDHETDSEWKQSLGRGIAGPHEGTKLERLPATTTTYEQFRSLYPDVTGGSWTGWRSRTATGGSRRPARRWTTANRWNGSQPSGCSPTAGSTATERRRSTGVVLPLLAAGTTRRRRQANGAHTPGVVNRAPAPGCCLPRSGGVCR